MQCAASIGQVSAVVVMIRDIPLVGVIVAMLMMVMSSSCVRHRLRAGARRRHDARELRHQEQGDQQSDKPTYRPKPIHLRLRPISVESTAILVSSHYVVNVADNKA
jgi:hypothetical protein